MSIFSFFKRTQASSVTTTDAPGKSSQYPEVVQQIHREFHTASEKLLCEAKEILARAQSPAIDKAKRLLALGFKQAKQAEEGSKIIKQAEVSKEQADLINYYMVNYPNNKFITEEILQSICAKYSLVCGSISIFKGFVPEKNLQDIENFKLKTTEQIDTTRHYFFVSDKYGEEKWELSDIHESQVSSANSWFVNRSKGYHFTNHMVKNYNGDKKICSSKQFPELLQELYGMKICAPIADMDMSGYKLDGYKVRKNIYIPDPVVLQPVKGGYLIVTAWGDEASDELVVNQNQN